YVDDVGGEMADSVPGMIRMRFGQKNCRYQVQTARKGGALSWLGIGGPKPLLIDVELRMRKVEAGNSSQLKITMLVRPADATKPPETAQWTNCCKLIFKDLRSYLMGK